VRLEAVQQGSAIADFSSRGLQESGEDIECRGLAGAIRADEADDLAVANREIQIGNGDEAAECTARRLSRRTTAAVISDRPVAGPSWLPCA
jgi:hypothetical protein